MSVASEPLDPDPHHGFDVGMLPRGDGGARLGLRKNASDFSGERRECARQILDLKNAICRSSPCAPFAADVRTSRRRPLADFAHPHQSASAMHDVSSSCLVLNCAALSEKVRACVKSLRFCSSICPLHRGCTPMFPMRDNQLQVNPTLSHAAPEGFFTLSQAVGPWGLADRKSATGCDRRQPLNGSDEMAGERRLPIRRITRHVPGIASSHRSGRIDAVAVDSLRRTQEAPCMRTSGSRRRWALSHCSIRRRFCRRCLRNQTRPGAPCIARRWIDRFAGPDNRSDRLCRRSRRLVGRRAGTSSGEARTR